MKNELKYITTAIVLLNIAVLMPVHAENSSPSGTRRQIKNQYNNEIKTENKEHRADIKELIASRAGALKNFINSRAMINNAVVTGKGTNSLTVTAEGKTITVNVDTNSRLRRRFFGMANISEIQVNDKINITGKWTDDAHTVVSAVLIRDMSIQKRFGVFVGAVTAISGNDITISTIHRGSQKATVTSTTKFVDRKGTAIAQTDIIVGHKLRVKGTWDNTNNTISDVSQVKDYSLPIRPTPKTKMTVTPTPTMTVTPTPTQ
jgi:hypothetical protein